MPTSNEEIQMYEEFDSEFLKHRQIFLWGDVNFYTSQKTCQQLLHLQSLNNNMISITICSDGGDLDCGTAIIDTILHCQKKDIEIETLAIGSCCSIAADILTFGTKGKRFSTQNSSIMFHPCSYALSEDYAGKQEKYTEFIKSKSAELNKLVAKNIGKKEKEWQTKIEDGLWLTAKEALKLKVIDGII